MIQGDWSCAAILIMIKVRSKQSGVVHSKEAATQKAWSGKTILELIGGLSKLPGFKLNSSEANRLKEDVAKREAEIKAQFYKIARDGLDELRAATPSRTGQAKAGWSLKVQEGTDSISLVLDNSDRQLIEMLNYGTRAHLIKPRNAKALHFKIGNSEIFTMLVHHPGTVGLGFIEKNKAEMLAKMQRIADKV